MKAFIYTGGRIYPQNVTERPSGDDVKIAADSGYLTARTLGVRPDVVLGDFDSLLSDVPDDIRKIQVPAEKDFTDTQMAVRYALEAGADEIVIIGGLSGRLDHTMSNLYILKALHTLGVYATANDGFNRVRYLCASSTLIAKSGYKYVGLIGISKKLRGVSIEGCKYDLKNKTLECTDQYAVSNEIVENCALISVRRGECFIIESSDVN